MKTNYFAKLFLGLFMISTIALSATLIYLKIKFDNLPAIRMKYENSKINQKKFSQLEISYLTYQHNGEYYFYQDYFEFLILQYLSYQSLEAINQKIEFYYDDLLNASTAKVVIGNLEPQTWNYSII